MSLVLDEHRHYLADRPRLAAFRAALRALVRPGDVVLDLACGTGILGFLACEAGAGRVYAVDDGGILDVARRFAQTNGFADRTTFIRELSTRVELPERADVVVCDQIGHLGIEAGVFEYLLDARHRLLKPGGLSIPSALTFMAAPVESSDLRERLVFWNTRPSGLDVRSARDTALNTGYPMFVSADQLLADPSAMAGSPLPPSDLGRIRGRARWVIGRPGSLDGVCAWFIAELAPGVSMTNAPGHPDRIDRRQVVLPIEERLAVLPGDVVTMEIGMLSPDAMVNWSVTIESGGGQPIRRTLTSTHSTFKGMLLSSEDLVRTHPRYRPSLTPAGRARRTVLELCDGTRSLREVEAALSVRHPEQFASLREAATFVAEVVTRYCTADAPVSDR